MLHTKRLKKKIVTAVYGRTAIKPFEWLVQDKQINETSE